MNITPELAAALAEWRAAREAYRHMMDQQQEAYERFREAEKRLIALCQPS